MLALGKITWARIPACNIIPRLVFPGEISRDFCKTLDQYLPPKPKKPAAPFLRYLKAMKDSIEKEYPEAKYKDIMQIAAEKWRLCPSEIKKPYLDVYEKERENYFYELNSYESNLSEHQKVTVDMLKDKKAKKREKRRLKKGYNELGKPKIPPGPYALFFATKKGQKFPAETMTEWATRIGNEWRNMPDIEKQPFIDQAKELRIEYEIVFDQWRKAALEIDSDDPLVKKAQRKIKIMEENSRDKLLNLESPAELLAPVSSESTFCKNSKASEPDTFLTKPEETVSVQTKLIAPSSRNSAITKIVSYFLFSYQRFIKSASRITNWDFSKLRQVAKSMKTDCMFQ